MARRFFCKELRFQRLRVLVSGINSINIQCNEGCGSEVKRWVQAGWNNWRRVSGVICDR